MNDNDRPGCLMGLAGICAFILSPAAYFVSMVAGGWHLGVKVGAALGIIGLVLSGLELMLKGKWIPFWMNLAWLSVPIFFLRWGNHTPAPDARVTAYWVFGFFAILAGLALVRKKVDSWE
jgi:hypothetical protein